MPADVMMEWGAAILGIVSVALLAKGDGRGWSIGAVMVVMTAYVYWRRSLHGSFALQGMFFLLQLLGWWRWRRGTSGDLRASARRLRQEEVGQVALLLLGGTLFATWVLELTGGQHPQLDGFVTVGSLLAQGLMVLTVAEAWLLWIVVDVVYIGLSARAGMISFALLYLVFTGLAVQGWREWTRDRCTQQRNAGLQEERQ